MLYKSAAPRGAPGRRGEDGVGHHRAARFWGRSAVGIAAVGVLLAACSYLPDSANPTTWNWRRLNPVSWFESEPPKTPPPRQAAAQRPTLSDKLATGDKAFPSVNDTPAKPQASPSLDRQNLAQ